MLLLGTLAWYLGFSRLLGHLSALDPAYLGIAIALIAIATLIGAFNVYLLLNIGGKAPSFRTFLPAYWLSWAIGLVFPGQIGDVASLALLLKKRGIEFHTTLGRSAADKLISLLLMAGIGLWGIARFPYSMHIDATTWMTVAAALGLLVLWMRYRLKLWISARFPAAMDTLRNAMAELIALIRKHPALLGANMGVTLIKIVLAGASYWYLFRALGYDDIRLMDVVPLVAASSLVAYLPISLNGMGTAEVAGIALFGSLGLPPSAVLTAYLTLRVSVLILAWVPASLWMLFARQEAHRQPLDQG